MGKEKGHLVAGSTEDGKKKLPPQSGVRGAPAEAKLGAEGQALYNEAVRSQLEGFLETTPLLGHLFPRFVENGICSLDGALHQ